MSYPLSRRHQKTEQIEFPTKLLCIDLLDEDKNNMSKITMVLTNPETGVVTEIPLLPEGTGLNREFLTNYQGFKRVLKYNAKNVGNVYSSGANQWFNIQAAMGGYEPNHKQTVICFANSTQTSTSTTREGIIGISDKGVFLGWNGGTNFPHYRIVYVSGMPGSQVEILPVGKSIYDIWMYGYTYDPLAPNEKIKVTRDEPYFTAMGTLAGSNNAVPGYQTGKENQNAKFRLGVSQEGSYYRNAGGLFAGFCIYNDVLTDEQIELIYKNRRFY